MSERLARRATHGASATRCWASTRRSSAGQPSKTDDDDGGGGEGRRGTRALCLGQQPARIPFERPRQQRLRAPVRGGELVLEPLRGGRQLVERSRQGGDELTHDLLALGEHPRRAIAAHEVDAGAALVALERRDQHDSHLRGGSRVRAAAGLAVEALGLDDADAAQHALGRLDARRACLIGAQHASRGRGGPPTRRRWRASRPPGRRPRRRGGPGRSWCRSRRGGRPRSRPAPPRRTPGTAGAGRGAAACGRAGAPRRPALHALARERPVEHVQHVRPVLDHGHDARVAERARVPRLPAALGVEGRAVEDHGGSALVLAPRHDGGFELEQVRIGAVEPLRHCSRNDCSPGASLRVSALMGRATASREARESAAVRCVLRAT